jgi:cytochrome c-type biogenesis protein CcmH/NrfG
VYILDTLAAAYAEAGRFEDAVTTQKKLLSMAKEDDPRLTEIQLHLKSYQDNKPWREN